MELIFSLFKVVLPLAYLLTVAIYAKLFFSSEENRYARKATVSLIISLVLLFLFLVLLGKTEGRCPLATVGEGLLFMTFILSTIHFISETLADSRRLGLFTLLPATVCVIAAVFLLKPENILPEHLKSSLLVFHIVASLASYACFSMASILAGLYLLLHRRLKSKNFDLTFRKLPPLDKLDKLSATWSFLGTVTMVISSIIGIWWVRKGQLEGMAFSELAIYIILLVFLGTGLSRRLFGMRGRIHAILILIGFAVLLLTNLIGAHGFQN